MLTRRSQYGFTLIEVLVVVAIIGILAAFAYPAYMDSVRKSNRADAQAGLSDISQRLERCYTMYSAYDDDNCSMASSITGGNSVTTSEGFYDITGVVNRSDYTLTATPVAGKLQASDDACQTFTLDQSGVRDATGTAADACW